MSKKGGLNELSRYIRKLEVHKIGFIRHIIYAATFESQLYIIFAVGNRKVYATVSVTSIPHTSLLAVFKSYRGCCNQPEAV